MECIKQRVIGAGSPCGYMPRTRLVNYPLCTARRFVRVTQKGTIMNANELDKKVMEYVSHFEVEPLEDEISLVGEGQKLEIYNKNPRGCNLYYQWLSCLMRLVKPKQVVELGAAAGISTIMIARELPKDAKFYSVDPDPQSWRWMKYQYPQLTKIMASDLDLSIYPKDCDLSKTDVWFIDSLHEEQQLRAELKLYTPFFKKGAIVILDDINLPEMRVVWDELPYDKWETTIPLHYNGFGHFIV